MSSRIGITRYISTAVLVILLAGCTSSNEGSVDNQNTNTPNGNVEVVDGVAGIELEITNAVAPFNSSTNGDSQLLEQRVGRIGEAELRACMGAEGFGSYFSEPPKVNRDDPKFLSHLNFPDFELLSNEGIVLPPSTPGKPNTTMPQGYDEAFMMCAAQVAKNWPEREEAQALFGNVRAAWDGILIEIDESDEVKSETASFSECLLAEGIPAEHTRERLDFLSYIDTMRMAATNDSEDAEIRLKYGQLYAKCGEDLFRLLERMRSERRADFLADHQTSIQELANLLADALP